MLRLISISLKILVLLKQHIYAGVKVHLGLCDVPLGLLICQLFSFHHRPPHTAVALSLFRFGPLKTVIYTTLGSVLHLFFNIITYYLKCIYSILKSTTVYQSIRLPWATEGWVYVLRFSRKLHVTQKHAQKNTYLLFQQLLRSAPKTSVNQNCVNQFSIFFNLKQKTIFFLVCSKVSRLLN